MTAKKKEVEVGNVVIIEYCAESFTYTTLVSHHVNTMTEAVSISFWMSNRGSENLNNKHEIIQLMGNRDSI